MELKFKKPFRFCKTGLVKILEVNVNQRYLKEPYLDPVLAEMFPNSTPTKQLSKNKVTGTVLVQQEDTCFELFLYWINEETRLGDKYESYFAGLTKLKNRINMIDDDKFLDDLDRVSEEPQNISLLKDVLEYHLLGKEMFLSKTNEHFWVLNEVE